MPPSRLLLFSFEGGAREKREREKVCVRERGGVATNGDEKGPCRRRSSHLKNERGACGCRQAAERRAPRAPCLSGTLTAGRGARVGLEAASIERDVAVRARRKAGIGFHTASLPGPPPKKEISSLSLLLLLLLLASRSPSRLTCPIRGS